MRGLMLGLVVVAWCATVLVRADDEAPNAKELTEDNFKDEVSAGPHFVMFFAPWCGHCKRLAPTWDQLAVKYNEDKEQEVKIGRVDCTQQTALCSAQDVTGYPTLKFFKSGAEAADGVKYRGQRDQAALEKFIRQSMDLEEAEEEAPAPAAGSAEPELKDGLTVLSSASFAKGIETGDAFIKFYAPWCGHCIKLAPTWDSLAKEFEADDRVKIAKIDCTANQEVCKQNEVRGYPTLAYFKAGAKVETYKGGRGLDDLKSFVSAQLGVAAGDKKPAAAAEATEPEAPSNVVNLGKDNFKAGVETGITFVKFYAPWCGHCKRLAPTWAKLADKYSTIDDVAIAHVDCTVEENANRALCDAEGVNGFPTLNMYKNGEKVGEYSGKRDLDALVAYVDKHFVGIAAGGDKDEL